MTASHRAENPQKIDAILIVEDNPDDLHFILRAFSRVGSSVRLRTVTTGQEALDYLQGEAASDDRLIAVLLDLQLPMLSGFQVLAHLKATPGLRRVPVIILTSSALSQDVHRAYDLGANSYLIKPARPAELSQVIGRVESYWIDQNRPA